MIKPITIELTGQEANALHSILEWASKQEALKELTNKNADWIGFCDHINKKIEEATEKN